MRVKEVDSECGKNRMMVFERVGVAPRRKLNMNDEIMEVVKSF